VRRSLTALLVLLALLAIAGCGDDDDSGDKSAAAPDECQQVEAPASKPDGSRARPRSKLDPASTYDVEFETSCGNFTVRLDVKGAPSTTASFAALARDGFYDDTTFHRIVPNFVIQGGDPTGTGTGGPGYKTVDKPPADTRYSVGVVAMAKAGDEAPGTAGSQFYVVSGPDALSLTPDYAVVGNVVEGLDTIERIEALGDPNSGGTGTPLQPVVVERATVSES
jgi:peptidyl-prolyl cis-trans isomerase B (cyclophilin B)